MLWRAALRAQLKIKLIHRRELKRNPLRQKKLLAALLRRVIRNKVYLMILMRMRRGDSAVARSLDCSRSRHARTSADTSANSVYPSAQSLSWCSPSWSSKASPRKARSFSWICLKKQLASTMPFSSTHRHTSIIEQIALLEPPSWITHRPKLSLIGSIIWHRACTLIVMMRISNSGTAEFFMMKW